MKLAKIAAVTITSIAAVVAAIAGIMQIFEEKPESHKAYGIYEAWIKRPLDAFLSTGALIVFSPILLATAILVRLKLGSPILFTQDRPGRNEKIFKLYKFRTMTDERDENGELLPDEQRLTEFGKKLRETSLDELPELINLVKGDMAVVGPRPQLVRDMVFMSAKQRQRHTVKPGLTGLAQINGRNGISWGEKLDWDLKYLENISFWGDVNIVFDTLKAVFKKSGITDGENATALDYGDALLKAGAVTQSEYIKKQEEAKKILEAHG